MTSHRLHHAPAPPLPTMLAFADVVLGVLVSSAPHRRLNGPGLTTALQVMPASGWGVAIAVAGAIYLISQAAPREAAMWLATSWYGFFAATVVYSFFTIDTAGPFGVAWCLTLFAVHLYAATWRVR